METDDTRVEIQFRLHRSFQPPAKSRPEAPLSGNGRLPRVTQIMALAIHFQDLIKRGEARDYADLARLGCLTRERMSQIMELVWLAPDIQQEILGFKSATSARFPISEVAVRKVAGLLSWDGQRAAWRELKSLRKLE